MTPQELIHQVMCDVGPALKAEQVTAGPDAGFWQIALDPETVFDVEHDASLERVVFSSRLAKLRPDRRLEVCELLLQVNFGWRETGGVRMALDPRADNVVMMFEMPVAAFHLAQLCTVLTSLADMHRAWRQGVLA
jgi:hypothetical protein